MPDQKLGLLVAGFHFGGVDPAEFNDWYDTEHVPERARTPGFINCERWVGVEDPQISIATYDLQALSVLQSPAYLAIGGPNLSPWSKRVIGKVRRICRFEAEQTLPGTEPAPAAGAAALLLFAMNPLPAAEADFNAWYDEEHVPAIARVPGCLSARRFAIRAAVSDGNQRYLALYHLASPGVCASAEWAKAVETPWTHRMRPQTRDRMRIVLSRYERSR